MASSSGASRPPRGLQKRQLFILVSLEASRIDLGRLLDLLGLDFGPFLDTMFTQKLTAKQFCHWSCAVHFSYLPSPEQSLDTSHVTFQRLLQRPKNSGRWFLYERLVQHPHFS